MPNYSGVIPFYRNDFSTYKHLDDAEFKLRWAIMCLMGWDIRHPEAYGRVLISQKGLAEYLGWSEPKVSKWLKNLLNKKLDFNRESNGTFVCQDYRRFEMRAAFAIEKERTRRESGSKHSHHFQQTGVEVYESKSTVSEMKDIISIPKEEVSKWKDESTDNPIPTPLSQSKGLVSFNGESFTIPEVNLSNEAKRRLLIDGGFYPETLDEPCFCLSGKSLINCCAVDVFESLKGIKE